MTSERTEMVLRGVTTGPSARAPRYGLLVAAETVNEQAVRWEDGYEFEAETCGFNQGASGLAACQTWNTQPVVDADHLTIEVNPFIVWAADQCSTFGFQARDGAARARRALEAVQSAETAREFWTGDEQSDVGHDAGWLANPATLNEIGAGGSARDIVEGLACLDQAVAGVPGAMIHLSVAALMSAAAAMVVRFDAGRWMTPIGTTVVADAGYDGSGPAGAGQWAYGTGPVRVRLSSVEVTPSDSTPAQVAMAMDRSVNTIRALAWRAVAVEWDYECAHYGVRLDVPTCPDV